MNKHDEFIELHRRLYETYRDKAWVANISAFSLKVGYKGLPIQTRVGRGIETVDEGLLTVRFCDITRVTSDPHIYSPRFTSIGEFKDPQEGITDSVLLALKYAQRHEDPDVQEVLQKPRVKRVFINSDAYSEMISGSHTSFETGDETGGRLYGWPCVVKGSREVIPWITLVTHEPEDSSRTSLTIGNKDPRPRDFGFGDRLNPYSITRLGTWHTHPRMGVFLSGGDHHNFSRSLNRPWSVQIVIDPFKNQVGALINKGPRGKEIPLYIYTGKNWEECWK